MIPRPVFLTACAFTVPLSAAYPQAGRRQVEEGNRLFAEERYDEARQKYLEALAENPTSPLIHFNEANALYQSAEFAQALEAYERALQTDNLQLQAQAWYNLGNALYRQQQYQQSLDAYKEAMRRDPTDRDAKYNYEFVKQQLEQQPDQPQQGGDQNDDQQRNPRPPPADSTADQPPQQQPDQSPADRDEPPPDSESPQTDAGQPPMTREEAERLLRAVQEDPGQLRRPPPAAARRVKKDW